LAQLEQLARSHRAPSQGSRFRLRAGHLVKDGGEQRRPDYLTRNPQGVVPLLEIGEGASTLRIAQSLAIIEWLEATSPAPPLLPRDPYLAARVRWLAEIVNSGIQPLHNSGVLRLLADAEVDEKVWARECIERGLLAFQTTAAETAVASRSGIRRPSPTRA